MIHQPFWDVELARHGPLDRICDVSDQLADLRLTDPREED
jgi:hypothetical protein